MARGVVVLVLSGLALDLCLSTDPIPPGVHPGTMTSENCSTIAVQGNRFFWLPRANASSARAGAVGGRAAPPQTGYIVLAGDGHDGQKPGVPTMCVDASGGKQHLKGYTCGAPGCTGCQNQWYHFDASDSSIRWEAAGWGWLPLAE
jgi:hypothetical protein